MVFGSPQHSGPTASRASHMAGSASAASGEEEGRAGQDKKGKRRKSSTFVLI